jgi:hypothetical protein
MFNSYIMSPPEVWGPPVWTLFHTLIEKMHPDAYPYVINSTFGIITRICKVLPCPECSRDASNFLAKINLKDYKTKTEFKNMLYLFHNWVNAKKRKPLFNYANMNKYANLHLQFVINNFLANYNTKGNMKLLTESFQRSFIVKDFISWFKTNYRVFITPPIITPPVINILQNNNQKLETTEKETQTMVEKNVEEASSSNVEEDPVTLKDQVTFEESTSTVTVEGPASIQEELIVVENQNVEKVIVVEETIIYEKSSMHEEEILNETIVSDKKDNIEPLIIEEEIIKPSKKKKNKEKK